MQKTENSRSVLVRAAAGFMGVCLLSSCMQSVHPVLVENDSDALKRELQLDGFDIDERVRLSHDVRSIELAVRVDDCSLLSMRAEIERENGEITDVYDYRYRIPTMPAVLVFQDIEGLHQVLGEEPCRAVIGAISAD